MKELSTEQIQKNWEQLRNLITNTFEGDLLEKLNKMYDHFEDRMCNKQRVPKEHFHYFMLVVMWNTCYTLLIVLKVMNLWVREHD